MKLGNQILTNLKDSSTKQYKSFGKLSEDQTGADNFYYKANDAEKELIALKKLTTNEDIIKRIEDIIIELNNIRMEGYGALKEGTETEAGNDFDEVASYMYQDAGNEIDQIPSKEGMEYIADVTDEEYNQLYDAVKTAIENVADHFYNGMIELSDRATMYHLSGNVEQENPDEVQQVYANLRDEAFEKFQEETGVEIWQDGRSGRHIVVDDNYYNAKNYNELCNIQEKWEDWVIEEFEKKYPFPEEQ